MDESMKPIGLSMPAKQPRADLEAFEAEVERCRVELDRFFSDLMDHGYGGKSGAALLAAMMRQVCAAALRLRQRGRISASQVQKLVDRIVADTAKARMPACRLTAVRPHNGSRRR